MTAHGYPAGAPAPARERFDYFLRQLLAPHTTAYGFMLDEKRRIYGEGGRDAHSSEESWRRLTAFRNHLLLLLFFSDLAAMAVLGAFGGASAATAAAAAAAGGGAADHHAHQLWTAGSSFSALRAECWSGIASGSCLPSPTTRAGVAVWGGALELLQALASTVFVAAQGAFGKCIQDDASVAAAL
jgi:hypothetical protein